MHVWILFPTPIIYVEYYIVGMNHDDLDKEGRRTSKPRSPRRRHLISARHGTVTLIIFTSC